MLGIPTRLCNNTKYDSRLLETKRFVTGKRQAPSAITFQHIAQLPSPLFPAMDAREPKDRTQQIKKQERQRLALQQAMQLHLDNSTPDAAPSAGAVCLCAQVRLVICCLLFDRSCVTVLQHAVRPCFSRYPGYDS